METLWFWLIALMLASYVLLDGFDLGAGALHLLIARTGEERRLLLASIGPVWDGNEVWLLASGGVLYLAFPALYAASFSGFYLPLMMVLWLLILRGIGITFRSHVGNPLWHALFDSVFSISSLLLTIFLGAALGNVIRGVPLDSEGYFFEPLWTSFNVDARPGVLDWYTVLVGILALASLATHGANYIAVKTEGDLNRRARRAASAAGLAMGILALAALFATVGIRPQMLDNYRSTPVALLFPVAVAVGLAAMFYFQKSHNDRAAFFASGFYIAAMLGGTAFALYPYLLFASTDPGLSLTVHNSAAGAYALQVGLVWWIGGIALVIACFTYLFHVFRGKVSLSDYH
jgi:cytochrome d ubiquinol oxidase subunit II